jgi:hypothetical protein
MNKRIIQYSCYLGRGSYLNKNIQQYLQHNCLYYILYIFIVISLILPFGNLGFFLYLDPTPHLFYLSGGGSVSIGRYNGAYDT